MSGRYGLRLWIAGIILAVLGAIGAVAWLVLTPADGEGHTATSSAHHEADGLPSFEGEASAAEPEALAAPMTEATAQPEAIHAPVEPAPVARQDSPSPPRHLTVTVVDADGRAIAGAVVQAFNQLPNVDYDALVRMATAAAPVASLDKDVIARAAARRNRALDPTWAEPIRSWMTDGAGTAFVELPSVEMLLVAERAPEGSSGVVTIPSSEKLKGVEPRPTLKLSPRGTLNGRVLTIDGGPAAGASVIFSRGFTPDEEAPRPRMPLPLLTDADGRFRVEVDTRFLASVQAERDGAVTMEEYAHVWPGRPGSIELRFPGAFGVDGVVLGPDGATVAGAKVDIAGYRVEAEDTKSDGNGRFHLTVAHAGHVVVVAETKGLVQSEPVAATLSDAQPVAQVELRMEQPASISGTLRDADGQSVAMAMVSARVTSPDFSDPTSPEVRAYLALGDDERDFRISFNDFEYTGQDGRFRFETLRTGFAYDLTSFLPGEPKQTTELKAVAAGTQDVELSFARLVPGADVLQGRVVDAGTRSPLSPCKITSFDWRYGAMGLFGEKHFEVQDADAHFRIADLDPKQQFGLQVEAVGYPPTKFGPFKPSADEPHELAVGRHGGLDIVVSDASGAAQPGASVQLMEQIVTGYGTFFQEPETRQADARGRLAWQGLRPGAYTLEAVSGGMRAPRVKLEVEPSRAKPVQLVVIKPEGTGRLEVRVTRLDGSVWAGADVRAVAFVDGAGPPSASSPLYMGRTGADGVLVLENLLPGHYAAFLANVDVVVPMRPADVAAEGTTSVTLTPSG